MNQSIASAALFSHRKLDHNYKYKRKNSRGGMPGHSPGPSGANSRRSNSINRLDDRRDSHYTFSADLGGQRVFSFGDLQKVKTDLAEASSDIVFKGERSNSSPHSSGSQAMRLSPSALP